MTLPKDTALGATFCLFVWIVCSGGIGHKAIGSSGEVFVNEQTPQIADWRNPQGSQTLFLGRIDLAASVGAGADAEASWFGGGEYRLSQASENGWMVVRCTSDRLLNKDRGDHMSVKIEEWSRVEHIFNGLSVSSWCDFLVVDSSTSVGARVIDLSSDGRAQFDKWTGVCFQRVVWSPGDPWYGIAYTTAAAWMDPFGLTIMLAADASAMAGLQTRLSDHKCANGSNIFAWEDTMRVVSRPKLIAEAHIIPSDSQTKITFSATGGPIVVGNHPNAAQGRPNADGLSFSQLTNGSHAAMGFPLPGTSGYLFNASNQVRFLGITKFPAHIANKFHVSVAGTSFGSFSGGESLSFASLPGGGAKEFEIRWDGPLVATNEALATVAFPLSFNAPNADVEVSFLRNGGPNLAFPASNSTIFAGSNLTLLASAVFAGSNPTLLWRKNGMELPGATNSILALTNLQVSATGEYSVVMSDTSGTATGVVARVTVLDPWIRLEPASQQVKNGASATFEVEAGGSNPLGFQWLFEGRQLTDGAGVLGANGNRLTVANVQSNNVGGYHVIVTNASGSITSRMANLTMSGAYDPIPGLVAAWLAEGTANDAVGNNHGTLIGGALIRGGKVGSGFLLDGNTASVLIPDSADLNPTEQITVEAWVKPEDFVGNGANAIAGKGAPSHSPPYYQYNLSAVGNYGRLAYTFGFAVAAGGNYVGVETPGNAWKPGEWYHVVGSYDGAALMLYTNGTLAASVSASGPIPDYGRPLVIGGFSNLSGPNTLLPGVVDEVALYRRALTAEEIFQNYVAGKSGQSRLEYFNRLPKFNTMASSDGNLIVTGESGLTNGTYYLLTSTNLRLPLIQWTRIATNFFRIDGSFGLTNAINPSAPQQFLLLHVQ